MKKDMFYTPILINATVRRVYRFECNRKGGGIFYMGGEGVGSCSVRVDVPMQTYFFHDLLILSGFKPEENSEPVRYIQEGLKTIPQY